MALVSAAPLVFARTAFVDFRPRFLAAPPFAPGQLTRARDLVLKAIDGAERLGDGPRWLMFASGSDLIAGVVARAPWLSDEFTHELDPDSGANGRLLHAFVGLVIRSGGAAIVPDRSQALYRDLYAKWAGPRWRETRVTNTSWEEPSLSAFEPVELPVIDPSIAPLTTDPSGVRMYPNGGPEDEQRLWEAAAAARGQVALCLRMPSTYQAIRSGFDAASAADVQTPRTEPRPPPKSAQTSGAISAQPGPSSPRPSDKAFDLDDFDERQKKKSEQPGGGGFPLWIIAAAAVAAIAAILLLLRDK